MGDHTPPNEAFRALTKRYAQQRRRGSFPSGMFPHAAKMEWVDVNTPVAELEPPPHPPLTDAELQSLVGKPVYDIRIAPTKHTPKNINWKLSPAGAREHWRVVQAELKKRMGKELWNELEKPHELREDSGSELSAYSFAIDFKTDLKLPKPPPLPTGHPLHGLEVPMEFPMRRRTYVSDVAVLRIHPTNFGPKQLWEHLTSLRNDRIIGLRMPKQDSLYLLLQGHETGHAFQPQPDTPTHNESYHGEYHADDFMGHMVARLGVKRGVVEAFHAARAVTSLGFTAAIGNAAWSCHTTSPALYFGGLRSWPISRLNALRKQVRAHTDMLLVGEGCNLDHAEIRAYTAKNRQYFKKFHNRHEEVKRQLGRARLAEAKVDTKPALKVERRLLALKKMWNDPNVKMDRDMLFMVGHTLEAAALFWPDIKDPSVRLTPSLTKTFRPRKKPAPEA